MRYALLVEYEGTEFHGSQLQPGVRTVQGELEAALATIYGSGIRIHFAGRTDAGVHAQGQVAAVDLSDKHSPETLRNALNYYLPEDIAVRQVAVVDDDFDPRRQAQSRKYIYSITDDTVRPVISRRFQVQTPLLEYFDDMVKASELFVGTHDFASFAGPLAPKDAGTIRRVDAIKIRKRDNNTYEIDVIGNAFVHQQVRRMAGALVRIGIGKLAISELRQLVEKPDRGATGWPLGPQGLCLSRIDYGIDGPFRLETEYN